MRDVGRGGTAVRLQVEEVLVTAAVFTIVIGAGIAAAVAEGFRPRIVHIEAEAVGEALPQRVLPPVVGHGLGVIDVIGLSQVRVGPQSGDAIYRVGGPEQRELESSSSNYSGLKN